jgi:hypothetical protein
MGEEERGREIVPDRDAAEEDQMQLIRQRVRAGVGKGEARIVPGPQHLAIEALDRDGPGLEHAGMFAPGGAGEVDRLRPRRSLRGHVLEFAGMSGIGEQRPAHGKMQREPGEIVPAGETAAGIDCVVQKGHVSLRPA